MPAIWLALALFALKALVPGGYMLAPATAHDGSLQITLCTSQGPVVWRMDKHQPPPDEQLDAHAAPCVFSAAAHAWALLPPPPAMPVACGACLYRHPAPAWAAAPPSMPGGPPLGPRAPPLSLG